MKHWGTMSRGATESMLKPARLRTERRIMPRATRMKGFGMGSRCSSTSSTISSVSLANGLSITCAAPSDQTLLAWVHPCHVCHQPPHGQLRELAHHASDGGVTRAVDQSCDGTHGAAPEPDGGMRVVFPQMGHSYLQVVHLMGSQGHPVSV